MSEIGDGAFVGFRDAFKYLDTHGLPLAIQMDFVEARGLRVALDSFIFDAIRAGWKWEKAIGTVRDALEERHGTEKAAEVMKDLAVGCKRAIANGILTN